MKDKTIEIIRIEELTDAIGVSKSTLWRMRQQNLIPKPIQLSPRLVGWEKSVIEQWLAERRKEQS